MVKYRDAYIEDAKVLADSGTETIDIEVTDPITELLVEIYATNHSGAPNKLSPISRCVSKIELVDGSDVLYSLSGQQALAMAFYDQGRLPHREVNEWVANRQVDIFPIIFGRYLGDPQLGFDPTRFKNPQLKVTWNLAAVNAVGSGGFATGTGRLTIIAKIMEEIAAKPAGFLMNKELKSWTTADSGDETTDLPTDYPYRKLCVRSYEANVELTSAITKLKLSCDQDKFIPFNLWTSDLARMMEAWFGKAFQSYQFTQDDDAAFELWMDMDIHCWGLIEGTGVILNIRDPWSGRVTLDMVNHAGAAQTACSGHLDAVAACMESAFAYPFGDQEKPEEWFNAPAYKSVRLIATQGNAGGAASIFLQQHRKY